MFSVLFLFFLTSKYNQMQTLWTVAHWMQSNKSNTHQTAGCIIKHGIKEMNSWEPTRQFPELQSQWALNSGSVLKRWRWSLPLPRCRTGCPLCFCSCCNVWQYMTHPLVFQNPAWGRDDSGDLLVMLRWLMNSLTLWVTREQSLWS